MPAVMIVRAVRQPIAASRRGGAAVGFTEGVASGGSVWALISLALRKTYRARAENDRDGENTS
jgi:hypothetical protein